MTAAGRRSRPHGKARRAKHAVALAASDADVSRCWPVLRELRPHIGDAAALTAQVRRQEAAGYRLAFIEAQGRVVACAGFRVTEHLAWGRVVYVDDLATLETERSKGHGERLMNWLADRAGADGCGELHLDSGVQRFDAHRFYFRQGLAISSHHFSRKLK
jgi:GNAT superfamily N-acetyltransferase